MKLSLYFLFIGMALIPGKNQNTGIKFGLFADSQYCNCDAAGSRFYRNSIAKLKECISNFNLEAKLKFVVGLGDLIDRDIASFDSLHNVLETSSKKIYHLTGNHDYEVEAAQRNKVSAKLGLKRTYYEFSIGKWRFVFLDGNEITLKSGDPAIVAEASVMLENLKAAGKPNAYEWNGGISREQLQWLNKVLETADRKNQNTILFCHYPLLPYEAHALWNHEEVLEMIEEHKSVKAYFNGHNHAGNYLLRNGIHFITFKGMVETENENAYALVTLKADRIIVEGYGREPSRELMISD